VTTTTIAFTRLLGMAGNRFTIADPADGGMLDIVGFSSSTPQVLSGYARGDL